MGWFSLDIDAVEDLFLRNLQKIEHVVSRTSDRESTAQYVG